jgi:hypothetical protein
MSPKWSRRKVGYSYLSGLPGGPGEENRFLWREQVVKDPNKQNLRQKKPTTGIRKTLFCVLRDLCGSISPW